ncbi:2-amino-4-hydroxy-6-hydroxymethyldihydropteridine diphosphokinase [candidate division KSB1 bacterium]|nr:2-amino-4-hydroxy-6-hydroxymethyldihydropteridine diphosphokinase [candidate division KSB1 bacterium]
MLLRTIFLGLGSNEGNRSQNLENCIGKIKKAAQIKIIQCSSIYESEPVGYTDQNWFLNAVLKCKSDLNPFDLLSLVKEIEDRMGREKTFRWGPRVIDIDILTYSDQIIESETLTIPHQEMPNRRFVLIPLAEIEPSFIHPQKKISIEKMLEQCPENKIRWYANLNC